MVNREKHLSTMGHREKRHEGAKKITRNRENRLEDSKTPIGFRNRCHDDFVRLLLILFLVGFLCGFVQMAPILEHVKIEIKTMPGTRGAATINVGSDGLPTSGSSSFSKECMDVQVNDNVNVRFTPKLELEPEQCLIYEKPSPYIELLMRTVVGFPNHGKCAGICDGLYPYDATERKYGNDWPPYAFTMIGQQRLENFRAAILEVNRNKIPGAIVELGVWRGGAVIMAAAVSKEAGVPRDIWVVDAFEDLPPETYGAASKYLFTSEAGVRENFNSFYVNDPERVHFLKGMFHITAPVLGGAVSSIAVLRVDGNFYDCYQDVMYNLYEKVPVGGIVIMDDVFSHPGPLQFWLDFRNDQGLTEKMIRIDRHSGWFRKERVVPLDITKIRPPGSHPGL
jgi:Macrocin-O-methyltransferase (TylF)